MTKGHLSFSLLILALKSPISSSLSVLGMPHVFYLGFVIVVTCTCNSKNYTLTSKFLTLFLSYCYTAAGCEDPP